MTGFLDKHFAESLTISENLEIDQSAFSYNSVLLSGSL